MTSARERLDAVLDPGWSEHDAALASSNPLSWPGYSPTSRETVVSASGTIGAHPVDAIAFDFEVLGGSMGIVAGEKIARAFDRAIERRASVIAMTATGGARMQEGMPALAQMAKTVVARTDLAKAGLPFIAWLGNPTTGGVYASFASLADVLWAEPNATIGFAGPRVAERVTGKPLPEGSHTAEFAMKNGLIDGVVPFDDLQDALRSVTHLLSQHRPQPETRTVSSGGGRRGDAWDEVVASRDPARPTGTQVAETVIDDAIEIHGDRSGADDAGVRCGFGRVKQRAFGFIALNRSHPTPAGYRKARRLLAIAGRWQLPVVTFIDTPGADPSSESEAGGIAGEIAQTFAAVLDHPTPIIAVVIGEGGSGGALALAAGNRLLMCEHSVFSVIAPEGAAAILKRDDVEQVARLQKLTAHDVVELGIADGVIFEGGEGFAPLLSGWISAAFNEADRSDPREERRRRWRNAGNAFLA